jgi:hypothetical protein
MLHDFTIKHRAFKPWRLPSKLDDFRIFPLNQLEESDEVVPFESL